MYVLCIEKKRTGPRKFSIKGLLLRSNIKNTVVVQEKKGCVIIYKKSYYDSMIKHDSFFQPRVSVLVKCWCVTEGC